MEEELENHSSLVTLCRWSSVVLDGQVTSNLAPKGPPATSSTPFSEDHQPTQNCPGMEPHVESEECFLIPKEYRMEVRVGYKTGKNKAGKRVLIQDLGRRYVGPNTDKWLNKSGHREIPICPGRKGFCTLFGMNTVWEIGTSRDDLPAYRLYNDFFGVQASTTVKVVTTYREILVAADCADAKNGINLSSPSVFLLSIIPVEIATCDPKVPTELTAYSDFLALTCHFFQPTAKGSDDPSYSELAAQEWPQDETQNRPQLNVAGAAVLDSLRDDKRSVKKRVLSRELHLRVGLSTDPASQSETQWTQNSRGKPRNGLKNTGAKSYPSDEYSVDMKGSTENSGDDATPCAVDQLHLTGQSGLSDEEMNTGWMMKVRLQGTRITLVDGVGKRYVGDGVQNWTMRVARELVPIPVDRKGRTQVFGINTRFEISTSSDSCPVFRLANDLFSVQASAPKRCIESYRDIIYATGYVIEKPKTNLSAPAVFLLTTIPAEILEVKEPVSATVQGITDFHKWNSMFFKPMSESMNTAIQILTQFMSEPVSQQFLNHNWLEENMRKLFHQKGQLAPTSLKDILRSLLDLHYVNVGQVWQSINYTLQCAVKFYRDYHRGDVDLNAIMKHVDSLSVLWKQSGLEFEDTDEEDSQTTEQDVEIYPKYSPPADITPPASARQKRNSRAPDRLGELVNSEELHIRDNVAVKRSRSRSNGSDRAQKNGSSELGEVVRVSPACPGPPLTELLDAAEQASAEEDMKDNQEAESEDVYIDNEAVTDLLELRNACVENNENFDGRPSKVYLGDDVEMGQNEVDEELQKEARINKKFQILLEREILKVKAVREGVSEEKVVQLLQLSCLGSDFP